MMVANCNDDAGGFGGGVPFEWVDNASLLFLFISIADECLAFSSLNNRLRTCKRYRIKSIHKIIWKYVSDAVKYGGIQVRKYMKFGVLMADNTAHPDISRYVPVQVLNRLMAVLCNWLYFISVFNWYRKMSSISTKLSISCCSWWTFENASIKMTISSKRTLHMENISMVAITTLSLSRRKSWFVHSVYKNTPQRNAISNRK